MDFSCVGKRIREARIQKSWKQDKLAEKTGLSAAYIGMIERGEKYPNWKRLSESLILLKFQQI